MNRFEPTTEDIKKPEAQENHEAPRSVDNPEELRQQMTNEAEKQTDQFKQECADDLSRVEARAEKDGLTIDREDSEQLRGLETEADTAKAELVAEIDNDEIENAEAGIKKPSVVEVVKNDNFEGSIIVKTQDAEGRIVGFALRKNGSGDLEGNKIGYMKDGSVGWVQQLHESDFAELARQGIMEAYEDALSNEDKIEVEKKVSANDQEEISEADNILISQRLQKSKIGDRNEAVRKLMLFVGVDTKQELLGRLKEKDDEGDNVVEIDMFTPDNLKYLSNPSDSLLRRVRNTGNALGYSYMNTPGYKSDVDDLVSKLKSGGEKEKAERVEEIFAQLGRDFEYEKDNSQFQKIDDSLFDILRDKEKLSKYVEDMRNLPPDAIINLYHGLNSGGYESALEILNGDSKGIEQRSGPTLSVLPLGQFWKGVGFKYALRRDQIEFPGENNPNAVVQMRRGDDGIDDTGYIVSESGNLPLDKFEADVMRSRFTLPDADMEKKLVEKLQQFKEERNASRSFEK